MHDYEFKIFPCLFIGSLDKKLSLSTFDHSLGRVVSKFKPCNINNMIEKMKELILKKTRIQFCPIYLKSICLPCDSGESMGKFDGSIPFCKKYVTIVMAPTRNPPDKITDTEELHISIVNTNQLIVYR